MPINTTLCILLVLAIDGGWGPWSTWSLCSGECGTGIQTRYRNCNKPEPKHGGKPCAGDTKEERSCVCEHNIAPNGKTLDSM